MSRTNLVLLNVIVIELAIIVFLTGCRITVDRPEANQYMVPDHVPQQQAWTRV
jgi:hypothetical protein